MSSVSRTSRGGWQLSRRMFAVLSLSALSGVSMAADPIVVGQVAPFSGPQAVTGQAINAGAKLYFDSINAKGGVRGRPIKLVTRDDAQKPEETVRLTKELIAAESPVAMIGTVGTSNLEALAKDGILVRQKLTLVGAVSGAASVAQAGGMHAVKASYHDEVDRLFGKLAMLGVTSAGLVYQNDGLGRDVLAGAEAASKRSGVMLDVRSSYERNTTAVEKSVAEMVASKVQVIFLGATTAAGIEFVKQYRDAGGTATIYGMSIIDTDALLKALGPQRSRGYAFSVVLPLAHQTNRAVVREYLALRQTSKDPNLSARSIEGFIAAKALVKVLEESKGSLSASGISNAIEAAKAVDVGSFVLDFSQKDRTASRYVDFAMFGADGKIFQ